MRYLPILLFVFALMLTSCQTFVDLEKQLGDPKVVVNSLFNPDSTWEVSLRYARPITADPASTMYHVLGPAGVVRLFEEGVFIETLAFNASKNFAYVGLTRPEPGKSYLIEVETEDGLKLSAGSQLPLAAPSFTFSIDSLHYERDRKIELIITLSDPGDVANFYDIKILKRINERIDEMLFQEPLDPALSSKMSSGRRLLFDDRAFNGKQYEIRLQVSRSGYLGVVAPSRVVVSNVSEDFYQYFTTLNLQENTKMDPFAEPVQVYSNIENGLGIFAGYSATARVLE